MKKTCFFIGHREAGTEIKTALTDAVEKAIVIDGVEEFIVGHYGGFDSMATATVIKAKKKASSHSSLSASPLSSL